MNKETLEFTLTGGKNSIIAHVVGLCEGTRTWEGKFTDKWEGHTDPGNKRKNVGSFSYQSADLNFSPAVADGMWQAQMSKVLVPLYLAHQVQGRVLGTFVEWCMICDLYTQAPAAVTLDNGIFDHIYEHIMEQEYICKTDKELLEIWASIRTASFYEPDGRLNAPGFGNSHEVLLKDQKRRAWEILKFTTFVM